MTTDTQRAAFEALVNTLLLAYLGFYRSNDLHACKASVDAILAAFDAARGTAEHVRRDAELDAFAASALERAASSASSADYPGGMLNRDQWDSSRTEWVSELRDIAGRLRDRAASPAPETPRTTDEAAPRAMAAQPAGPDARSTTDAAVVLTDEQKAVASHCAREGGPSGSSAYRLIQTRCEEALTAGIAIGRATRSTDSSAEAAQPASPAPQVVRDEAQEVTERERALEEALDMIAGFPPTHDAHQTAQALSIIQAMARVALAPRAAAPHTADETRVDGGT